MHRALRAQPENIVERVHKNTTQFLYSDGFQQLSLQRQRSIQSPLHLMEKLPFISAGFGAGSQKAIWVVR